MNISFFNTIHKIVNRILSFFSIQLFLFIREKEINSKAFVLLYFSKLESYALLFFLLYLLVNDLLEKLFLRYFNYSIALTLKSLFLNEQNIFSVTKQSICHFAHKYWYYTKYTLNVALLQFVKQKKSFTSKTLYIEQTLFWVKRVFQTVLRVGEK